MIKWGNTVCSAVKWGNTNCTVVKWGNTVVFPAEGLDGGSISPLFGGFYTFGGNGQTSQNIGLTNGILTKTHTYSYNKINNNSFNYIAFKTINDINFSSFSNVIVNFSVSTNDYSYMQIGVDANGAFYDKVKITSATAYNGSFNSNRTGKFRVEAYWNHSAVAATVTDTFTVSKIILS